MLNPYRNLDELPFVNKKATKNVLNSLIIFIYIIVAIIFALVCVFYYVSNDAKVEHTIVTDEVISDYDCKSISKLIIFIMS